MSSALIDEARPVERRESTVVAGVPQPNFFIVGSAKAGSTSLVHYLAQHPEVFMPSGDFSRKEPAHFCDPIPPWQAQYKDFNNYLRLFEEAGHCKAIGEASVTYLISAGAEERIHAKYPHAKIIIILRNPADRAYSWYTFMCQFGVEGEPSFERALAEEAQRAADVQFQRENWVWHSMVQYFKFGLCADDIARFLRRFPKKQMHFLLFEDLKKRPLETTRAVFEFLEVDPAFTPNFTIQNPTYMPLSVVLQHAIAKRTRLPPAGVATLPPRLIDKYGYPTVGILNLLLGKLLKRGLNPVTRRELLNRYREDIARTEALIGRSLDTWLNDA